MPGVDVFCERCGTRQPAPPPEQNSPGILARKFLDAVGLTTADGVRPPYDDYLRLCLGCREYSCPTCWNDEIGLCQTCAPLPEPAVVWVAPEPKPEPVVVMAEPEPVVLMAELEPEPEAEPEPVLVAAVEAEVEPVAVAIEAAPEPEPEPVAAEPEPVAAEPEPEPVRPRMPVLPLPRPRRPETELPLPPLVDYPVAPQIHFERHHAAYAEQSDFPAYAHMPAQAPVALSSTGVRPCRSCQLSLSAKARFCRRCGTSQAA